MEGIHHILYVDAYDSFSNNIVGLLEKVLNVSVTLVRIDNNHVAENLEAVVSKFDAVVVGPGPGHPGNADDVGFIDKLWTLSEETLLPILGICLGFQSLSLAFGADVRRMRRPRHGIVNRVAHAEGDIFNGVETFDATQYHSLCVDIGHQVQRHPPEMYEMWTPAPKIPKLQPLAWDLCDEVNGPVLMSVRHTSKPFWGVQYHPESICTSSKGHVMIQNWWYAAQSWNAERGRHPSISSNPDLTVGKILRPESHTGAHASHAFEDLETLLEDRLPGSDGSLLWASQPAKLVGVIDICKALGLSDREVILFDSQGHQSGRYSIIGLIGNGSGLTLSYTVHNKRLLLRTIGEQVSEVEIESLDQIWPMLKSSLDRYAPSNDQLPRDSPFWGGWMGFISYEAGLDTLEIRPPPPCNDAPDLNFAFIQRSIVLDHQEQTMYFQSLIPHDNMWILEVSKLVDGLSSKSDHKSDDCGDDDFQSMYNMLDESDREDGQFSEIMTRSYIDRPCREEYCRKVWQCQESLSAGDSYELCLTDETQICIPRIADVSLSPWTIYKKLRENNPAPFGCYISLNNTTVIGSSPERFLRWTREGRCQFRPIKGTVKKSPEVDLEAASSILNSSKERAENLMIVDLIRHDLSGVVGARSCIVPKLMQVEEYKTVYQLVSVIEGQIPDHNPAKATRNGQSPKPDATPCGIDVLKASLPPGSMTGAPKKRSCEILSGLEKRPRGLYSGVIGYMDVGGGGDFSVVIRTATKQEGDIAMRPAKAAGASIHSHRAAANDPQGNPTRVPHDLWRIGAGGAVTIQSTDIGEFEEMETKLDSVLKTFQG